MSIRIFAFIAPGVLFFSNVSVAQSISKTLGVVHLDEEEPVEEAAAPSSPPAGEAESAGTAPAMAEAGATAAPVKSAAERRKAALTAFDIG